MTWQKINFVLLILFGMYLYPQTVSSQISGERLIVEGVISKYSASSVKAQHHQKLLEIFSLNVSRVIEGNENSKTINVVHFFYKSESLKEGLLKIGSKRRLLVNKIILPNPLCEKGILFETPTPCYSLQADNVTTLEDNKLLNLSNFLDFNQSPIIIEKKPSKIFKTDISFFHGKLSSNGRHILSRSNYEDVNISSVIDKKFQIVKTFPSVQAFNFSADSKIAILANVSGKTLFWETERNRKLKSIKSDFYMAQSVAFSKKNNLLIVGDIDGNIFLINSKNGKIIKEVEAHQNTISTINFSPDEETFVTGSGDGTAKLWNKNGHNLITFKEHYKAIYSATFSADGKFVLTAGGDKIARLWSIENGDQKTIFQGHSGSISSAVFSSEGDKVLTSSIDGTIRLWKINGEPKIIFAKHNFGALFAGFGSDSKTVVSGGFDFQLLFWKIPNKFE